MAAVLEYLNFNSNGCSVRVYRSLFPYMVLIEGSYY